MDMENSPMENAQSLLAIVDSRFDSIQNCVEAVAEDVSHLTKVLIVGNGQPAMTVRMAVVEKDVADLRTELSELKAALEVKGNKNWQGLLLLLSVIASLITALLNIYLRHP